MTLSIITITYNNPEIQKTLDSVFKQKISDKKIEHIIVDNLSNDNTKKIVQKYQKKSKYSVTYIRESDTGRYNAMNKGIAKSKGKYLLFLNAGDSLHQNNTLQLFLNSRPNKNIIYGDIEMIYHHKKTEKWSLSNQHINKKFFLKHTIFHQAAFIQKKLFDKYGLYDENYQIVGDFDFFIKTIVKNKASTKYLPITISDYDTNGISSQISDKFILERTKTILKYYNGKVFLYNLIKYLYYKNKKHFPQFLIDLQKQRLKNKPKENL